MNPTRFSQNRTSPWKRLPFALVPLAAACCLLGGATQAQAYDNDTHYLLTYYLGVKVGFTPREAHKIAFGNIKVDYDKETDPVRYFNFDARARHHAFTDGFLNNFLDLQMALKFKEMRGQKLLAEAMANGDPGQYLHYLQDSFSHEAYGSIIGQVWNWDWHRPDYISADPDRAGKMALATVDFLEKFLKEKYKREPLKRNPEALADVLGQLSRVNPAKGKPGPDYNKAKEVISKALGMTEKDWVEFSFDKDNKIDVVRIEFDNSAPKRGKKYGYDENETKEAAKPFIRTTPGSYVPGTPSRPRITTPTVRTPTPMPTPIPASTPTPGVVYQPTNGGGISAPSVPFPSVIPSTPAPSIAIPTPAPVAVGTGRGYGYDESLAKLLAGRPGTPTPGNGITFDNGVPKVNTATKGVSMRIGIDRGTLQRVEAPPTLITNIRADD